MLERLNNEIDNLVKYQSTLYRVLEVLSFTLSYPIIIFCEFYFPSEYEFEDHGDLLNE